MVSFALSFAIPDLEGRSNSWWLIPLPADLVPVLLLFVSCVALLASSIRALLSKRQALPKAFLFVMRLLLFGARLKVPPAELFHRGFSQYTKTILTVDEWRSIARFAQAHLKPGEGLPGPGKNLWSEPDHRALWSELIAKTQIGKLDPSLYLFVSANATDVVWGGALAGHRGVTIFSQPGGQLPQAQFIAEDIAEYISED